MQRKDWPTSPCITQCRPEQWIATSRSCNIDHNQFAPLIHDLRHHFISALAQTQATDATIKSLAGHISHEMLEHYSHVCLDAKRKAVEALDAVRTVQ
jgi:hypothetical protein